VNIETVPKVAGGFNVEIRADLFMSMLDLSRWLYRDVIVRYVRREVAAAG
jgi:hypothetical protein